MATINLRGSRWYLTWSQNGRQHRESLGRITEDDAEKFRRAKEIEVKTGQRVFVPSAHFDDHLKRYLDWHSVQFPDSHVRVKQICSDFLGDFAGRPIREIAQADIERWKATQMTRVGVNRHGKQTVMSSETAAKELRTLKAVLNKAVEWGELEKSPARSVKAPKNLRSQPIHWYSKAELARLYKFSAYAPIWRLMANTGMRRGEAQQVRWIDVKRDHIQILSTEDERTKSGKWRQVPLSDSALQALRVLRRVTGKKTYVLPHMTGPSLSRAFRLDVQERKMAGSLHSLRHSYAAHLVMAGVPLRTIQVLMGHASITTTEKYAHIGNDHLQDQARLINL